MKSREHGSVPLGTLNCRFRVMQRKYKRSVALTRYLDDGAVSIENNLVENQIRQWVLAARTGCLRISEVAKEGGEHEPWPVGAHEWG